MAYNPELVKQLLGENIAEMMDGTIEVISSKSETTHGLKVGDTLVFKFKDKDENNEHLRKDLSEV